MNDFCPAPSGTVAIPLQGAPAITYHALVRAGFASEGTLVMRRLIAETVPAT